jgi:membrane protein DedA with SNARE-associated domain
MLEIILVVAISQKIAAMLNAKGRSAVGYVILFVALWVGGEIMGAVIGVIITIASNPNAMDAGFPWMAWVCGLVGAAIGGGIGYAIAAGDWGRHRVRHRRCGPRHRETGIAAAARS